MNRSAIAYILLAATISGAGCYTILRHPGSRVDLTDETGVQKDCADCHSDADLYHLPGGFGDSWYSYYPAPWAAYYAPPWWFGDDYWNRTTHSTQPPPVAEPDQRHVWNRDASTGTILPPGAGNSTVAPPANSGKPAGTSQEKPAKGDKEDEKGKKRHVWGR